MKHLLVLRHAKSSWKEAGLADHDRPLNKRGARDAPAMGGLVMRENLVPDLILSSSAVRARSTALAVFDACANRCELRILRELYLAGPETYLRVLSAQAGEHDRAMVVGHNPGIEELVEGLTGVAEPMPTGALALVDARVARWSDADLDGGCRLVRSWRPRDL